MKQIVGTAVDGCATVFFIILKGTLPTTSKLTFFAAEKCVSRVFSAASWFRECCQLISSTMKMRFCDKKRITYSPSLNFCEKFFSVSYLKNADYCVLILWKKKFSVNMRSFYRYSLSDSCNRFGGCINVDATWHAFKIAAENWKNIELGIYLENILRLMAFYCV